MTAPVPDNEPARLAALRAYGILGTPPEAAFDDLARLAADLCAAPVAQVNFIDERCVWTKAWVGGSASGIAREHAFCAHAILRSDPTVVPETLTDARFATSPLVLGEPHVRFYAAAPVLTPEGYPLGTVCVLDRAPRTLPPEQIEALVRLSAQAMAQLELRRGVERARADLRAADERFRLLVEGVRDYAVVTLDLSGRVASWNAGAERMLRYREREILGEHVSRFFPPEDVGRGVPAEELARALAGGRHEREGWQVSRDGLLFWAEAVTTVLRDDAGQPRGFSRLTRDLTERKQAEEALHAHARRQAALAELGRLALGPSDLEALFDGALRAAAETLGVHLVSLWELLPGGARLRLRAAYGFRPDLVGVAEVSAAPGESQAGYTLAARGGVVVPDVPGETRFTPPPVLLEQGAASGLSVVVGGDGDPFGVLAAHATRRRAFGQEDVDLLQSIANVLAQTVQRERAEVARRREARLRLTQRFEAVGRLAGGVAHDFNNLLTTILGRAEMALAALGGSEGLRAPIEEIQRAAERASGLVGQLLAFGRGQVLQPSPLDLNAVLEAMRPALARAAGAGVEVVLRPGEGLAAVQADRSRLTQAVEALVRRARAVMPDGGRVVIETAQAQLEAGDAPGEVPLAPGRYVVLSVSDSGPTLDAEARARVFEPFFTSETTPGGGLALPMVYGIVKQSGGYVWVEAGAGGGSTFKICLPRVDEPATPVTPGAWRAGTPGPSGGRTILLVEDEAAVRRLAREVLARAGYQVLEAAGGAAGVALFEAHQGRIDLLLTDVVMPGMTGRELASRLTALRPDLKVIYMSGYTAGVLGGDGGLGPGDRFLDKPFRPAALVTLVAELLRPTG